MKINYLIDLSIKNKNLSNIFKIKYCLNLIKKTVSKKFFVAFSSSLLIMISSCAFDDGYSSYVPNKPRSLNYNNPYDLNAKFTFLSGSTNAEIVNDIIIGKATGNANYTIGLVPPKTPDYTG